MNNQYYCAVDLGAGSGRVILGRLNKDIIEIEEIHRFNGYLIIEESNYKWDIHKIISEIGIGLDKINVDGTVVSIGIDTWGVDYVLLDQNDQLIELPFSYRDSRTDGMIEQLEEKISKQKVYAITGIQFLQFNTIYQLFSITSQNPECFSKKTNALLIPDYLAFILTGIKRTEYTIASTTQMLDIRTNKWSEELYELINISDSLFPPVSKTGEVVGSLKDKYRNKFYANTKFVSVASHDTASAIAAIPVEVEDSVYISSGTWSLMGIETNAPILTEDAMNKNFTNEGGVYGTLRFLKNIMGMWLFERLKKEFNDNRSYTEIISEINRLDAFKYLIDVDDNIFLNPESMADAINNYLDNTGQAKVNNANELYRLVFDCLALKYYETLQEIREITSKEFSCINIIGGGSRNFLLCQLTAELTGLKILAGPVEATAIGNILVQAISMGDLKDLKEGRSFVKKSFEIICYEPENKYNREEIFKKYFNVKKIRKK